MTDELTRLRALLEAATAGPWRTGPVNEYIFAADSDMVAMVRGFGAESSGKRPPGSQAANARAIAALGTLWPALMEVVEAVEESPEAPLGPRIEGALDELRAAIRKALGE